MKFKEMPYERPNISELLDYLDSITTKINDAKTAEEQLSYIKDYDNHKKDFETSYSLASVRHTIDTRDEFYEEEDDFFNENAPLVEAKSVQVAQAIVDSKFKEELYPEIGKHYFDLKECSLVLTDDAIPFMQKDNELASRYNKLIANSEIEFEGKTYTLTQMSPLLQSTDREYRKGANDAMWAWFEKNEAEFDAIYDEMVHVRTDMAKALGYDTFTDLQYKLLTRTDYNKDDVAKYREKILKTITPIAVELRKQQAERLGLDDFKAYDKPIEFADGNPNPKGDRDFIVSNAQKMYRELSPQTGKFFDFMVENELMDLVAKPGKQSGGYCTSFDKYNSPFIFSNFNGTKGDVEVVTHEAGHAFQNFTSQCMPLSDLIWPTYEACEIHSMSMEFLTWPWMNLFFKEDTDKFKYAHLKDAICFIPYGVTIDEFQHFVYENPNATPDERKAAFHEIEMKYQPDLDYDNDFVTKGTYWFRQGHVFCSPFYYIDYTLAQVCAFQYLLKSLDNQEKAIEEYIHLCEAGGMKSFFNLLPEGNIENPMTTSVLEEIAPKLLEVINSIEF